MEKRRREVAAANGDSVSVTLREWHMDDFSTLLIAAFQPSYRNTPISGKVSTVLEELRQEAYADRQRADKRRELRALANRANCTKSSENSSEHANAAVGCTKRNRNKMGSTGCLDRNVVSEQISIEVPSGLASDSEAESITRKLAMLSASAERIGDVLEGRNRQTNNDKVVATVTELAKTAFAPYSKRNARQHSEAQETPRYRRQALSVELRGSNEDRQSSHDIGGSMPVLSHNDSQVTFRQNKWISERNKRAGDFINSDQIEGFRGTDTLECLIEFIGADEKKAASGSAAGTNRIVACGGGDRRDESLLTSGGSSTTKKVGTKKNGKKVRKENKRNTADLSGGYCSEDGISSRVKLEEEEKEVNQTVEVVAAAAAAGAEVKEEDVAVENNDDEFIPVMKSRRGHAKVNREKTVAEEGMKTSQAHRSSTPPPPQSSSSGASLAKGNALLGGLHSPRRRRSVGEIGPRRGGRRTFVRHKAAANVVVNSHTELCLVARQKECLNLDESFPPLLASGDERRQTTSLTSSRDASPKKSYNEKANSVASSPALNAKCSTTDNGDSSASSSSLYSKRRPPRTTTYAAVTSGSIQSSGLHDAKTSASVNASPPSPTDEAENSCGDKPTTSPETPVSDALLLCESRSNVHTNSSANNIFVPPTQTRASDSVTVQQPNKDVQVDQPSSPIENVEQCSHVVGDDEEAPKLTVGRPRRSSNESQLFQFLANTWMNFLAGSIGNCCAEKSTEI